MYCCDWFNKKLNGQLLGRQFMRDFQAAITTRDEESRYTALVNETPGESDVQNGEEVKRLIEMG